MPLGAMDVAPYIAQDEGIFEKRGLTVELPPNLPLMALRSTIVYPLGTIAVVSKELELSVKQLGVSDVFPMGTPLPDIVTAFKTIDDEGRR